jgi:N-acyl-D-amino-acid deacylase
MFDLIVRNGTIYNGSGGPSFVSDIAISGDRITEIGDLSSACARDELDASGLCVMPGFIDTHLHSDMVLLYDRQHANGLCQGITTEILGQDGLSYAPLSRDNLSMYAKFLSGLNGYFEDVPLDFATVGEYLDKFHKKTAINVAYQVPHGTIRLEAMGFHDRPLTGYALDRAKDLMRQGFEEGAVAFSTGLSYYPCSFSDTEELVELCRVCAEYDVPFVTHTRSVFRGAPFDPNEEAIEIARRAGCKLHFSHFRTGPENAGMARQLMEPIEKAMSEGIKITLETYPYYSGSGYAVVFLPLWAMEGGYCAILERLANPALRPAIIDGIEKNTFPPVGVFTHLKKHEQYIGMDFEAVAGERGQTVGDMLCDLLLEENLDVGYYATPTTDMETRKLLDRDFVWLLSRPYYMICTDSIPYGFKPHPRAFGTFPRFLCLAREHGMSYETFANRAAAVPAETFRIKDRGHVEKGFFGDLVIFDGRNVTDNATYQNPRRAPTGIKHVVVNGKIAVYEEKVTGLFSGYALRRDR